MKTLERAPQGVIDPVLFKIQSLELLKRQIAERIYPGYPANRHRLYVSDPSVDARQLLARSEEWWTDLLDIPGKPADHADVRDLPVHPWFDDMVRNRAIGALAGRGAYYFYGPNKTADPIVTRHDLEEPHVALVTRKDTGKLALPGGFLGKHETPLEAAMREFWEETGLRLDYYRPLSIRKIYDGPLADLRVTAHAWPSTAAYHIALPAEYTRDMPLLIHDGNDEVSMAKWYPQSEANDLFGSHKLLVQFVLREQCTVN